MSSVEAAIIYTLEPVLGAALAWWMLGERLGAKGLAGAAIILASSLVTQLAGAGEEPLPPPPPPGAAPPPQLGRGEGQGRVSACGGGVEPPLAGRPVLRPQHTTTVCCEQPAERPARRRPYYLVVVGPAPPEPTHRALQLLVRRAAPSGRPDFALLFQQTLRIISI